MQESNDTPTPPKYNAPGGVTRAGSGGARGGGGGGGYYEQVRLSANQGKQVVLELELELELVVRREDFF